MALQAKSFGSEDPRNQSLQITPPFVLAVTLDHGVRRLQAFKPNNCVNWEGEGVLLSTRQAGIRKITHLLYPRVITCNEIFCASSK